MGIWRKSPAILQVSYTCEDNLWRYFPQIAFALVFLRFVRVFRGALYKYQEQLREENHQQKHPAYQADKYEYRLAHLKDTEF